MLRDLSHELDMVTWLAGPATQLTALGGHFSELEITSDDHFSLLFQTDNCPLVSVQVDYLNHIKQRRLVVNTNDSTYECDFIRNTFTQNGEVIKMEIEGDTSYLEQHSAVLKGDYQHLCTYHEGLAVMKLITAAEKANATKTWVTL